MPKISIAKHLNTALTCFFLAIFICTILILEYWVSRPLPYNANQGAIQRHHRIGELFASILQPDSNIHAFLSRHSDDQASSEVILLDVDYDIVAQADAWPLPRNIYAEIIDRLSEYEPKTVVIDMIFEKPQTPWVSAAVFDNITPENASQLMPVVNQLNHDGRLKEALSKLSYALITVLANQFEYRNPAIREQYTATLKRHVLNAPPVKINGEGIENVFPAARISGLRESILPLQLHAAGQGFSLINFDRYGQATSLPLFHRLQSNDERRQSYFLPHIVTETMRVSSVEEHYSVNVDNGCVTFVEIGEHKIATNCSGEMQLNFYNNKHMQVVRASNLMKTDFNGDILQDKIVVFSSNTDFLHDYVDTPFGLIWGAEVLAYALSNILNSNYFYRPQWTAWYEIFLLILLAIIVLSLCKKLKPNQAALSTALLLTIITAFNAYLYIDLKVIVSFIIPITFTIIVYIQSSLLRVIFEERQKRFFKNALGLYLSPELSDQVADKPELLGLSGKEEHLTVLFSDIRNFSSISETMTPEELTSFLQHYFSPMTDIIFSTGGTLDKFIGDAIMAFWGAPLAQEDHAARACKAALEMLEAMDTLLVAQKKEMPGLPEIRMGIGIHSGRMRVGNMGSARRLNYTVIGDNVNLGSRLEGLTKHYGVRLIISEQTWSQLDNTFYGRRLDRVRVKGKEEPTVIYELMGMGPAPDNMHEDLSNWDRALLAYENQDWDLASELFDHWQKQHKDVTAGIYLQTIEKFRSDNFQNDWPPVSVMTEK